MTTTPNQIANSPLETAATLFERADRALDALAQTPGGEHEVFATHGVELKAVYEHDDFSVSASSEGSQYGIRTVQDGRLGFVTTNAEEDGSLRAAAEEARTLATVSPASKYQGITKGPAVFEYQEVVDPGLLTIEPEALYAYLAQVIEVARADGRVTLDRAEMAWSLEVDVIATSTGVRGSCAQAACHWMAMGMAKEGSEVTSFDYDGAEAVRRDRIEAEIARSMGEFRDSVVGSLGARPGESYRGKILLHPNVVMELLGEIVQSNCSGRMHVDDMTPWKGRVGELVASEILSIHEDPTDRDRGEWAPFDREGVPTARHALIGNGRLDFIAYDGFSARRAGVASTGNALGGAGTLPGVGFANVAVTADPAHGKVLAEGDLAAELGSGLVVKRFSGNVDPQSGEFSGIAKNSWWVRDGERVHAVNEVMIAGNAFDLLKQIVAAGDRQHVLMGAGRAPYLLVDGVSVTGA